MASTTTTLAHTVVIFYMTILGSAFVFTSSFYLFALDRLDHSVVKPHCDTNTVNTSLSSVTPIHETCEDEIRQWSFLTHLGLAYGLFCLAIAIYELWSFFWRKYIIKKYPTTLDNPIDRKKHIRFKTVSMHIVQKTKSRKEARAARRIEEERQGHLVVGKEFRKPCVDCAFTVIILVLWLTSLVIPIYLSTNLWLTNALMKVHGEVIHSAATSLFAISLFSIIFVLLSTGAVLVDICDFWSFLSVQSTPLVEDYTKTGNVETTPIVLIN